MGYALTVLLFIHTSSDIHHTCIIQIGVRYSLLLDVGARARLANESAKALTDGYYKIRGHNLSFFFASVFLFLS